MSTHRSSSAPACRRAAAAVLVSLLAAACNTTGGAPAEGIGFREARFQDMAAMRAYRACIDDARKMDDEARTRGNPGGYLASARLIESCEADLGPEAATIAREERMRAYALSALNYFKGGDVSAARANLERFKQAFPGQDLYITGGASFVDTMEVLTSGKPLPPPHLPNLLNVDDRLTAEVRRVHFWKRN